MLLHFPSSFARLSLFTTVLLALSLITTLSACKPNPREEHPSQTNTETETESTSEKVEEFEYEADRFSDKRILRYQVPGFENLELKKKILLYYLSEAALSGRDMMWDQNNRYNLRVRALIEGVVRHYQGDRNTEAFKALMVYAKEIWFANGIHHHYSNSKFTPGFSYEDLQAWVSSIPESSWNLPEPYSASSLLDELRDIIFNPDYMAKKIVRSPDVDKITNSAVNFYEGVTEEEVTQFYKERSKNDDKTPVSHGLNSKLVKQDGKVVERVWKLDGMYHNAIEKVVYWLEQAISVAETDAQKEALELLVEYYKSGDLKDFDEYNIAWVQDTESSIDVINGFIEVYNDPLGYRGSFESVVSFRDKEATKRIAAIAEVAQWFEDNSPIMDEHKKENVKGITGKVINVVMESGDASPATPIGINLPNSNWIRTNYGSKSVSLGNIVSAYDASKGKTLQEFAYSEEEIALSKKYAVQAGHLKTDMHEVIGHASGKLNPGVGTPKETLKQYASAMEEARADLVALYFVRDPKIVELGIAPNLDVGKVSYNSYIRNGLMTQLFRIKLGDNIEQSHMQNRQLVSSWAYELGKKDNVIEFKKRNGKTYIAINDYEKLREIFGKQLREIQRLKSEGDFETAKNLIETYGIKVNRELHKEVLERFADLGVAPYSGFINPKLSLKKNNDEIVDVLIEYPEDFSEQMLGYSEEYGYLPLVN